MHTMQPSTHSHQHSSYTQAPSATTAGVRASPLQLVVAVPPLDVPSLPVTRCAAPWLPSLCAATHAPLPALVPAACDACGGEDAPPTSAWQQADAGHVVAAVACGQAYFDAGEEIEPLDNSLLTMVAAIARDDAGRLVGEVLVLHGAHGRIAVRGGACPDTQLPALGGVRVLGVPTEGGAVRATLHRVVATARGEGAPRAVQSMLAREVLGDGMVLMALASKQLANEAVVYGEGTLTVDVADESTACPEGWLLSWSVVEEMTSVQ